MPAFVNGESGLDTRNKINAAIALAEAALAKTGAGLNDAEKIAFRAEMGFGNVATANFGTSSSQAVRGNDTRFAAAMQRAANGSDIEDKPAFRAALLLGALATATVGQNLTLSADGVLSGPAAGGGGVAPDAVTTWAAKPAPATAGATIFVTDVGVNGSRWRADGTRWKPLDSGITLLQGGAPINHTGTTAETTLASVVVPGGALGANGRLIVDTLFSNNNSGGLKTRRVRLDGAVLLAPAGLTTNAYAKEQSWLWAAGSETAQVMNNTAASFAVGAGAPPTSTADMTTDKTLTITGQLNNAADTITLAAWSVRLLHAA